MAPGPSRRYKDGVKRKQAAASRRPARRAAGTGTRPGQPRVVVPAAPVAFEGGCHCGAITYTYLTALPPSRWPVRLCQCSFCRGHGVRATSDPAGELYFRFERPELLRRYRFALRSADFLICKECGTFVAAVLLSGRGVRGAVNLNTLRAVPERLPAGRAVNHDGESVEARRARRGETWTPVVGPV